MVRSEPKLKSQWLHFEGVGEKVYLRCTIRTKDEEIAKLKSELAKVKEQLKNVKQNSAKVITRLCEQKYK